MLDMKRRQFITLLGGAAAWPLAVRAQQPVMPMIGLLGSETPNWYTDRLRAFREGLAQTGYVEGRNVTIDYRWAGGRNDRLPPLAAELVQQQVALIATLGNTGSALAAKAATSTIPIVFRIADPVEVGLVASLSRPGGNLTRRNHVGRGARAKAGGVASRSGSHGDRGCTTCQPDQSRSCGDAIASHPGRGQHARAQSACSERQHRSRFRCRLCEIGPTAGRCAAAQPVGRLATRHAVPTISAYQEFTSAGGLMSYGGSIVAASHQAGISAGRILNGEKPADLPVMQATKVTLTINLKTAKALGLEVPITLQAGADEVIE
jgi:putative tryptophan/tyrosine transport system substrate-binding protein